MNRVLDPGATRGLVAAPQILPRQTRETVVLLRNSALLGYKIVILVSKVDVCVITIAISLTKTAILGQKNMVFLSQTMFLQYPEIEHFP